MKNLIELLKETAKRYPGNKALIYQNKSFRYRELVSEILRLSSRLEAFKISKADKVGILLPNSSNFVISYFAILNKGAVVVALNNFLKNEELKKVLEDCELKFLITDSSFSNRVEFLKRYVTTLEDVLFLDKDITKEFSFLSKPEKDFDIRGLKSDAESDDVAVILYTSGTSGEPKGVMLSHRNLIFDCLACVKEIEVKKSDNFICMLPLFHSFPATVCMLLAFASGATTTIIDTVRPFSKVIRAVLRHRVTVFVSVPSVYNVLVNIKIPKIFFFRPVYELINPLRVCISGAAALPVETLEKFEKTFNLPLLEGYGLTETSPVVSLNPIRGSRVPGSIGLPLEGVEVKIVDEEGKEAQRGVVGELVIKGANVMKGYFNKPKETQEVLKDGWFYSGDLAKIDEKGFIYIVDRKKDMINVRGLKVYPREVEEFLYKHPDVKEAAVVGIKHEHHGEVPKAFVVLKGASKIDEHELLKYLRGSIASYKVPRSIEFRDSLPKTSTGKIYKKALLGLA